MDIKSLEIKNKTSYVNNNNISYIDVLLTRMMIL